MTALKTKTPDQIKAEQQQRAALARGVLAANMAKKAADLKKHNDEREGVSFVERLQMDADWQPDMGEGPTMAGDAQYAVIFSTADGVASRVRVEQFVNKIMPDSDGHVHFTDRPSNPKWK